MVISINLCEHESGEHWDAVEFHVGKSGDRDLPLALGNSII